jgi:hypothetical protein
MSNPIRIGPPDDETPDNSDHFDVPGTAQDVLIDPASLLADVAADLAAEAEGTFITLAVPARPDYMLTFKTVIDYDSLRMWMRRARDGKDKTDPHMLRLAFAVLSNTNTAILFKGHEVPANNGGVLTLAHPEFLAMIKASIGNSVPAAIRKFYAKDGHIITVMTRVLEEAGYADIDLEDEDNPLTR